MKLIKGGLLAALVAFCALAFTTASASANLVPARWTGSGWIFLNGGLGGTRCNVALRGTSTAVTGASFSGCSGIAGQPTPLLSWAIDLASRTITVAALSVVLGGSCLYVGRVAFTEALTPGLVITLGPTSVNRNTGGIQCPSSVEVTGSIAVTAA